MQCSQRDCELLVGKELSLRAQAHGASEHCKCELLRWGPGNRGADYQNARSFSRCAQAPVRVIGYSREFARLEMLVSLGGERFGASRCGALLDSHTPRDVDDELTLSWREPSVVRKRLAYLYREASALQDTPLLS